MKAILYEVEEKGKTYRVEDIPEDMADEAAAAREAMLESLAEADDEIMEMYLGEQDIDAKTIRAGIRRAANNLSAVPVLMGSAFKNKGVQPLLDAVVDYMPSPLDVPPVAGLNLDGGVEERKTEDEESFSALAFKLINDPYVGHLTFLRVYSGHLKAGSQVYNASKGTKEKIGRLLKMHADKREEIKEVYAGDIVACVGLRNTTTGDTLCDDSRPLTLEQLHIPEPVVHIAVEPKSKEDQDRLSVALGRIAAEDPSFRVRTDEETGQTIISGMGELHLEIIVDRLLREFKVQATVGQAPGGVPRNHYQVRGSGRPAYQADGRPWAIRACMAAPGAGRTRQRSGLRNRHRRRIRTQGLLAGRRPRRETGGH